MRWLLTALLASAAVMAGCGGGGDEGGGGGSVTVEAGGEVRVVGTEYAFDPSEVVLAGARASAAATVEITLDNQGALAHNLRVLRGDEELGGTPTFPGGRAESGKLRLQPGSYRMVCTVGSHEELGMVGALEVRTK
jgi:plastocyanin